MKLQWLNGAPTKSSRRLYNRLCHSGRVHCYGHASEFSEPIGPAILWLISKTGVVVLAIFVASSSNGDYVEISQQPSLPDSHFATQCGWKCIQMIIGLFVEILKLPTFGVLVSRRNIHSVILENVEKFESKSRNFTFDFVDIVFCNLRHFLFAMHSRYWI